MLYMAPEIIQNQIVGKPVDIWSVGIIMYMLLNMGKHPFIGKRKSKAEYKRLMKYNSF